MKRIIITGANGLLGQSLTRLLLQETRCELFITDHHEKSRYTDTSPDYYRLDITNRKALRDYIVKTHPEVIVHTAAKTNVDACEIEREEAHRVNVMAVEYIAEAARIIDSSIIHLSSDYVFDGRDGPYSEDSLPTPINYYGKLKLASENIVRGAGVPFAIVRTMILYGSNITSKPNFVLWVLNNLINKQSIRVVVDQYGQPTYVDDVAYSIIKLIEGKRQGLFHVSGPQMLSRYDFALAIADVFKLDSKLILPIETTELKQKALRPMRSEFIIQKVQVELGVKPVDVYDGLNVIKVQIGQKIRGVG